MPNAAPYGVQDRISTEMSFVSIRVCCKGDFNGIDWCFNGIDSVPLKHQWAVIYKHFSTTRGYVKSPVQHMHAVSLSSSTCASLRIAFCTSYQSCDDLLYNLEMISPRLYLAI